MTAPLTATFVFYGSLNDFLRKSDRGRHVNYTFKGAPAVKDAVEAIGVPHPEVACILQQGRPVGFAATLEPHMLLEVYPYELLHTLPHVAPLVPLAPVPVKFILDVHLGTLAKALRMLGLDTSYTNHMPDAALAAAAHQEQRILLTRDIGLLKQRVVTHGYWLRSQHTEEQLQEVFSRYNLQDALAPLARCLCCNTTLKPVAKADVQDQIPAKTNLYFNEFYKCRSCDKVYWKGSHYEHMLATVQHLKAKAEERR